MKFRIKKEIMANGTEWFIVEEKIFLFFWDEVEFEIGKRITPQRRFKTIKQAKAAINSLIKECNAPDPEEVIGIEYYDVYLGKNASI